MNSKLNHIKDWSKLARQVDFSVSALAKQCRVSVRTLERHFVSSTGKTPRVWLAERRHEEASSFLGSGYTVKETASLAGYQHASTFSREFKKHWGSCPVMQLALVNPVRESNVA